MDDEPLWRSRLRWRLRGAWLWPAFLVLTVVDGLLVHWLPISGDGKTDLFGAMLLCGTFNLLAVAVLAPLAAVMLRRRRPDLPKVIAQDYTGTAFVAFVTLAVLAAGLIHAPARAKARRDFRAQAVAARTFIERQAPPQFQHDLEAMTTLKVGDELYRTCAPGPDPKRWFCVYVFTDTDPPGVKADFSRESNASMNQLGAYR